MEVPAGKILVVLMLNHPFYGELTVDRFVRKIEDIDNDIKGGKIRWQSMELPILYSFKSENRVTIRVPDKPEAFLVEIDIPDHEVQCVFCGVKARLNQVLEIWTPGFWFEPTGAKYINDPACSVCTEEHLEYSEDLEEYEIKSGHEDKVQFQTQD